MRDETVRPPEPRNIDGLQIPGDKPGLPDSGRMIRMAEAASAVCEVMGQQRAAVTHSTLGPGWSSDFDVYLGSELEAANSRAQAAGWVSLDSLLAHLGHQGTGQWAVVASGRVLARADLQRGPAPTPSQAVLNRIDRRGEVGLREALEIRHLVRSEGGAAVDDAEVLAAAALIEEELGGTELQEWLPSPQHVGKLAVDSGEGRMAAIRRALRPRLRVALSGVDGAGKSSLVTALGDAFGYCGLPWSVVWTRPGLRVRFLGKIANAVKRVLGVEGKGLVDLASGARPQEVRSRRGVVGWVWSVLLTVGYIWDVRRRSVTAQGVVIYDRHLLDAIATIEALYGGADVRLQVWLVRKLIPRADIALWLDVPTEVSVSRKPDDLFNRRLVELQLERYSANVDTIPSLVRIDGTAPASDVALSAFRAISASLTDHRVRPWAGFVNWIRSRR